MNYGREMTLTWERKDSYLGERQLLGHKPTQFLTEGEKKKKKDTQNMKIPT